METAHEFFLHGLSDIMDGEKQLIEALGKNAETAEQPRAAAPAVPVARPVNRP